jgi:hypothetical protein
MYRAVDTHHGGGEASLCVAASCGTFPPSNVLLSLRVAQAEALCSRIGIMAHGHLACLGSPEHLQRVYGSGYYLDASCSPDVPADALSATRAAVTAAVLDVCPAVELSGG